MRFFLGSRFNEGILLINMDYLDYPNQWDKLEVKVIEIYSGFTAIDFPPFSDTVD